MRILGISPLDKDATASIVENGKVLFAAGEERFSRTKQQDGFPGLAVRAALEYTGMRPSDIDLVVYPFVQAAGEKKLIGKNLEAERRFLASFEAADLGNQLRDALARVPRRGGEIHGLPSPNEKQQKSFPYELFYRLAGGNPLFSTRQAVSRSVAWSQRAVATLQKCDDWLAAGLKDLGYPGKVKRMDHHLTHAANSYYCSGYDEALCITLDGYGTGLAGSVSHAVGGKIRRLHGVSYPNSLGTMYEHVTSSLGYRPSRHEGKIVGLAAYGDPEILSDILLGRVEQLDGDFRIYQSNNIYFSRLLASLFPKIDVAAAYQHVLELVAGRFVRHWVEKTGLRKIVLSGGVAANVKMNQRLFEVEGVEEVFVYPNMGDGGCGTGAALLESLDGSMRDPIEDAYFGPDYSEQDMEQALTSAGLSFSRPADLAAEVAALIHNGRVVARFDGRMEYGPRALGNRSILYHAREPEVNQWLNRRLGRTEFMPFAPVTLYEHRHRYYKNIDGAEHAAQFMTITFDCTDEMIEKCPAAVHVDGTARPQLIRREVNPGYYDILKEYEKLSGIGSLINTSFNMHEEPIVCSPADAVRAFLLGNLDFLVMGPFLVAQPAAKADGPNAEV